MVEFQRDGTLKMEFDPIQMPEFVRTDRPEYFQCWTTDGELITRSASLGQGNLADPETAGLSIGALTRQPRLLLPDGRTGRQVGVVFKAAPEVEEDAARAARAKTLVMAVARSSAEIDHKLDELLWLLVGVFGGAVL